MRTFKIDHNKNDKVTEKRCLLVYNVHTVWSLDDRKIIQKWFIVNNVAVWFVIRACVYSARQQCAELGWHRLKGKEKKHRRFSRSPQTAEFILAFSIFYAASGQWHGFNSLWWFILYELYANCLYFERRCATNTFQTSQNSIIQNEKSHSHWRIVSQWFPGLE